MATKVTYFEIPAIRDIGIRLCGISEVVLLMAKITIWAIKNHQCTKPKLKEVSNISCSSFFESQVGALYDVSTFSICRSPSPEGLFSCLVGPVPQYLPQLWRFRIFRISGSGVF